mgnify:CR=1 FL=1
MTKKAILVTPSTFNFTPRTLNALDATMLGEGQKARQFSDEKVNDLKLELTRSGKKTFAFRAQKDGKKQYQCIGSYPAIGIDEARKTALELRAQLDRGLDVSADRRRLRAEPTLAEFFHQQYRPHAQATKRSWRDDVSRFQRVELALGHLKLSALTRRDIEAFLLGLRGGSKPLTPASCNRFLALLSAMYRCALNWSLVTANPAHGIRQMRENNARTRALSEREQMAFVQAADAEPNQTAAAVLKGLALTGCRKSELQFARWEDVDLERAQLTLRDTKNGHGRVVLLNDEALALVASQPSRGHSQWVFPNAHDPEKAIVNIDKAWRRILAGAEAILGEPIEDIRIHDLRHTFASQLANANCSLHVIAQALGHRTVSQSARYAHIRNDVLREASDAAAKAFRKARLAANGENVAA